MFRLLILSIFWSQALIAASPTPKPIAAISAEHAALFGSVDHLSASFTQILYRKLRNKTIERTGTAYFSKPAKFRWIFNGKGQEGEEYFYNGSLLAHYQKRDKLVTYYSTKSGLMNDLQEIVDLVLDSSKLLGRYEIKSQEKGTSESRYVLRPKRQTEILEIQVNVSEAKSFVQAVKIEYTDGNYSQFLFRDPLTTPLDSKLYEFQNPGGVKVKKLE